MPFSCLIITNQTDFQVLIHQCVKNIVPHSNITICHNSEEAFAHLFSKDWDLVLVDYLLKNGLETLKRARQISTNPDSMLVLFSTPHTDAVKEEARLLGADAILSHEDIISKQSLSKILSKNPGPRVSDLLN